MMDITRDCTDYKKTLLPDEKVIWSGKPDGVPLLTAENRKSLILRWIACAVAFVVLTAAYVALLLINAKSFSFIVEAVFLIACAWIAYMPVVDWNDLRHKTSYYITNKRVILVVGKSVYALNRTGIKVTIKDTPDGVTHILWGAGDNIPPHRYRRLTVIPDALDENPCLIFYYVRESAENLRYLTVA